MSYRANRYVDPSDPLVQRPKFHTTYDFPIAKKASETDLPTVRSLLKQELAKSQRYKRVWQHSTAMFEKKRRFLESKSKRPLPDECHIAIIAYTFEKPIDPPGTGTLEIYVDFNRKCREMTSWNSFPYKSLYCLLIRSVSGTESRPDNNKGPYYRGVSFHYDRDYPRDEILVDFTQFTSFTTNKKVAENFLKSKGGKGALLVLAWPPMAGLGIANYSQFEGEEEVLVTPWSTFSVEGMRQEGRIQEVYLMSQGPYFDGLPYTINTENNKMNCIVS